MAVYKLKRKTYAGVAATTFQRNAGTASKLMGKGFDSVVDTAKDFYKSRGWMGRTAINVGGAALTYKAGKKVVGDDKKKKSY